MSLTIASDVVAGVMRAADPQKAQAARLRLAAAPAQPSPPQRNFLDSLRGVLVRGPELREIPGDLVLDVLSAADPAKEMAAELRLLGPGAGPAAARAPDATYRKFEALLLRSAFEDMLPSAASGAFGEGFAGSVWRSMAADQFASLFADHGGIGLAGRIVNREQHGAAESGRAGASPGQWPYFRTGAIAAFGA